MVFCDDAYFGLFYEDDVYRQSIFTLLYHAHENLLAIKVDGATKEDYVWGFRVGFLTFGALGLTEDHFEAINQKVLGTIRTTISSSSRVGQTLLYRELSSLVYHGIKEKYAKVLAERFKTVKAILETRETGKSLRALPFNSGYFMTFELARGSSEDLRRQLLKNEGIGTIALNEKYLRIAYSSVDNRDLRALFGTIFSGCRPAVRMLTVVRCLVVLGLLLLVSCDQSATRVSTLWTNVPEMASYVEKFNASQRDWQILVEYKADPAGLLTSPGKKPDLVVARGLASSSVKDGLVPLDFLFDGGNLAKTSFYKGILDAGQQGDRFKLLPVSFDLPVLIFLKKAMPDLPGFSLDLQTLKDLNSKFPVDPNQKPPRKVAFSPRWQSLSLTLLQLQGSSFREGFQGTLAWDSEKLAQGLAVLQAWPSPGWDQGTEFQRKYLQTDLVPPLVAGRVQFFSSTLSSFLARPWDERKDLDFRFIDQGGLVAATDSTVWTGIPSSSLTRGAAERFLAWFYRAETQKTLILKARTEDARAFGLAKGLSALVTPNAQALAEVWPEMAGRLPGPEQISFWGDLPVDWAVLKSSVLRPWLETPSATETSLKAAIEKHRAQAARN